jgi:hypothetical protein
MFIKKKVNPAGHFVKYKARLVAGGHKQMKDPTKKFCSPTMSSSSLFAIIAIAASERRHVVTVDINGAYLLAKMDEPGMFIPAGKDGRTSDHDTLTTPVEATD